MATKETETQEYEVGITIPKEEPKQEQNNYSETKQSTIDKLEEAKDYWNTAHVIGDKILEKSTAGRVYLVIQSTTGSVIVDTASGVPLDEQLVGIAGDIIGGFLFTPAVNAVLILNDISVGDILQGTYKDIKEYIQTDVEGQTWHYEENFNVMVGGQMVHYDYAKVKYGADGNAMFDNATQSPVFEQISKTTYDNYQKSVESLNSLKNINVDNGVKIELDNNQIVSMEKDNIKVTYEDNRQTITDTNINESTTYSLDSNNNLTPEYKTNLETGSVVPLQPGQTISHIAAGTKFSTQELLQFNGLSEADARNLPVGFEIQIPKSINTFEGGYGNIKVYEGQDGSLTYHIPADEQGTIKVIKLDSNGNVIENEFYTVDEINNATNEDILTAEQQKYIEENSVAYKKDKEEDRVKEETYEREEDSQFGGAIGGAVGGSIGSIIINNNDFSNIGNIAIDTGMTTIGQNVGEYLGGNSDAFDDIETDLGNTLQGAIISFAISSFFAKNDNLSDILGMDGTFLGDLTDYAVTFTAGYYASIEISNTITLFETGKYGTSAGSFANLTDLFATAGAGFVGTYIGNELADNWIDTKNEAIGSSVGGAIGIAAGAAIGLKIGGSAGSIGGPIGALIGGIIGTVIGGVIGGLFGGSKPPPPKANANYEFDEEDQSYNLISSGSSNGGDEQAMINIGKALASHIENMFNLPGGQLVNSDFLPDINVSQKKKTVTINGEKGSFSDVEDMLGNVLAPLIPFINVENGDEYILRALNRTNEEFLQSDINSKDRADLEKLYENISLAKEYSNYQNETLVIIDSNENLISDTTQLQNTNNKNYNYFNKNIA